MKLRNLFYLLLALPLVFAACEEGSDDTDKAPEVKDPVLTLTSKATVDVTAAGGEFEITYTLENKKDGVELTATCEAEWVDVTVGEKVKVVVEANEGDAREATVVVAYEAQKFEVTYKQVEKGEVVAPVLTLTSDATLEVVAEGADCEITYTLENPVEGVELTATCEANWVTDLATGEKVTFKVAANEGDARETKVVVAYGEQSFEVAVKQAKKAEKPAEPVAVTAAAFGGEYLSAAELEMDVDNYFFTLSDKPFTAEGGLDPTANAYAVDLYVAAYDGEWQENMTLPVGEYTLDTENSYAAGKFTAEMSGYMVPGAEDFAYFEAGKLVVTENGLTLTVTIDGVEHTVTYEGAMTLANGSEKPMDTTVVELDEVLIHYYGDYYTPGEADNFVIILSDMGVDEWYVEYEEGLYYKFDTYAECIDKANGIAVPYGTYTITPEYREERGFVAESWHYTGNWEVDEKITEGTLTVSEEGFVAEVVINGQPYKVVCAGLNPVIADWTEEFGGDEEVISTLEEDLAFNITGATFMYEDLGDAYWSGTNNYVFYIYEDVETMTGACVMLEILTSNNAADFAGKYEIVDNGYYEANTALPGIIYDDEYYGCWYLDMDYYDEDAGSSSVMAPFDDGSVTIDVAADGTHTFTFNSYDDAGNAITGTISGKLYGSDEGGEEPGDNTGGEVEDGVTYVNQYLGTGDADQYCDWFYFSDGTGNNEVKFVVCEYDGFVIDGWPVENEYKWESSYNYVMFDPEFTFMDGSLIVNGTTYANSDVSEASASVDADGNVTINFTVGGTAYVFKHNKQ